MKKVFVWLMAMTLLLTACTSAPVPEKPTTSSPKFQQEASTQKTDSAPAQESSQPAATESSTPEPQAPVNTDGMYRIQTIIDSENGETDVTGMKLYLTVNGTNAVYWSNGEITDTVFDPATGETEVMGDPGTIAFDGDMVTLVDVTHGTTYIFVRMTEAEAAAAQEEMNGGGGGNTETVTGEYGTLATSADATILEQHLYDLGYGYYGYLTGFKSNLDKSQEFTVVAKAYDAAGTLLNDGYGYSNVVAPGEEAMISITFAADSMPDHVDYELYYDDPWGSYESMGQQIEVGLNYYEDQLTIEATNRGTMDANWVEITAVFYDAAGNFATVEWAYMGTLTPGQKDVSAIYTWGETYDSVKCYVHSYGDGTATTPVDVSSIIQVLGEYETKVTSYMERAVVVKNISDKNYEVYCKYILRDAQGVAVDVTYDYIDVLAPGETSCVFTSRSTPEGLEIASKELIITVEETTLYVPVISDLAVTAEPDGNNLTVSITNNGAKAAEFVTATALFFDAENNFLGAEYTYITDSDSEIKPGNTESSTLWGPSGGFDHYEIYLDGRADAD